MKRIGLVALGALVLAGCGPRGGGEISGAAFLAPGVRTAQEQACAAAVSEVRGVAPGAIQVRRASSDPRNQSIVNAFDGAASGYCRVTLDAQVIDVVF